MGQLGQSKIHHYTIGRCGSAFISQILFEIFGFDNVWAGHEEISKMSGPVVITYRDFRDAMVSHWRVSKDIKLSDLDNGRKMTTSDVARFSRGMVKLVKTMGRVYDRNPHALLMKYEEFFPDNFYYIFNQIQSYFKISLTSDQINTIKEKFNLKKNKQRSDEHNTFKKVGGEWMHGNHVYKGTVGGWKELVAEKDHSVVENILYEPLKKWGYVKE